MGRQGFPGKGVCISVSKSNTKRNAAPGSSHSLVQQTIDSVIDYIHEKNLRPGDPLPSEADISETFSVSRTVVREASKSLAAMNILNLAAGRRAQVSGFDGSVVRRVLTHGVRTNELKILQICDVRRTIEIRSAELAALHRTNVEADAMIALAKDLRAATEKNDRSTAAECDIKFHLKIAEATRNPLFPVLIDSLVNSIREMNERIWQIIERNNKSEAILEAHERIGLAIRDNDPDQAVVWMNEHFDLAYGDLVSAGFI